MLSRRELLFGMLTDVEDEEGASLIEYVFLAVLVGMSSVTGMRVLGRQANRRLRNIGRRIR